MIYEVRTYTLKPRSVPEVEKRFADTLPFRTQFSPLAGLWHTEIGPLNQIVHIWGYESAAHRAEVRAKANQPPNWPPAVAEFEEEQLSEIYVPAPFMKPVQPGRYGPIYEMRIYTLKPGSLQNMVRAWSEHVEDRMKMSPLIACMYTEVGPLNRWLHLWAYKSLDERNRIRDEAARTGWWPPATAAFVSKQENKILMPAACSPLQ